MKKQFFLGCKLLIISCVLMYSCKNKNVDPELQSLMDNVMAVHDEVMPKMGEIHKLKKQLKKELKNNLEEVSEKRSKILQHMTALDDADEGMMNWMAEYKKLSKLEEDQDPMSYYQAEQVKIDKVRDDMLSSIENAKLFLNEAD